MPAKRAERIERPATPPEPANTPTPTPTCPRCEALSSIVARLARCSAEAGAWSLTFRAPADVDVVALIGEAQEAAQQVTRETRG